MGLTNQEIAQYTPEEVYQLQIGYERMQEKAERRANSPSSGTDPARESKLKREEELRSQPLPE